MATKTATVLPILYPATQELLKRYAQMRCIRIGQHSNMPLIIDKKQRPASSGTIARIVNQFATKLGLINPFLHAMIYDAHLPPATQNL